jgi:hypothetical protein
MAGWISTVAADTVMMHPLCTNKPLYAPAQYHPLSLSINHKMTRWTPWTGLGAVKGTYQ